MLKIDRFTSRGSDQFAWFFVVIVVVVVALKSSLAKFIAFKHEIFFKRKLNSSSKGIMEIIVANYGGNLVSQNGYFQIILFYRKDKKKETKVKSPRSEYEGYLKIRIQKWADFFV